jgi:hypothetical protein
MRLIAAFLLPVAAVAADPAAALQRARQVNAELAAQLPNFVVDETVMRYKSRHTDPPKWEVFDKIEAEVVVRGSGFGRQNVHRNGAM